MSETSGSQHIFGSVSSRESSISTEERRLKRETIEDTVIEAKQRRRLGRIF
jgi:hypothetical protein